MLIGAVIRMGVGRRRCSPEPSQADDCAWLVCWRRQRHGHERNDQAAAIQKVEISNSVPTLAKLVRAGIASANRIKAANDAVRRHAADALHEWLDQSHRLNIARNHHKLRGGRFVDFARRNGVDRSSSYQLVKLWQYRDAVLERCDHEQHYPGWQACLASFEAAHRRWPPQNPNFGTSDERGMPVAIFARYGMSALAPTDESVWFENGLIYRKDYSESSKAADWLGCTTDAIVCWQVAWTIARSLAAIERGRAPLTRIEAPFA